MPSTDNEPGTFCSLLRRHPPKLLLVRRCVEQPKLIRHSDIRTTMNICGDAAAADMRQAHVKIVQLALRVD